MKPRSNRSSRNYTTTFVIPAAFIISEQTMGKPTVSSQFECR
ncbi:hypothetical protein BN903_238 [Halorubrum sp. AJ67]|nr:hypothetical protein BN903_238 [Halorubrum sp. AJ67]